MGQCLCGVRLPLALEVQPPLQMDRTTSRVICEGAPTRDRSCSRGGLWGQLLSYTIPRHWGLCVPMGFSLNSEDTTHCGNAQRGSWAEWLRTAVLQPVLSPFTCLSSTGKSGVPGTSGHQANPLQSLGQSSRGPCWPLADGLKPDVEKGGCSKPGHHLNPRLA